MAAEKQDANLVGFFKSREQTLGVLPANPAWQTREPNSFDDLGGEYTKVARRPFNPSRQRKKGAVTDLDADGGYNEDLTQHNMQSELEEFFFAALRKTPVQTDIAAVASTDDYTVASSAAFRAGHIVRVSGFANAANNGIKVLNGITDGTHVSVADALVDEAAETAQMLKAVGFQFTAGDLEMTAAVGNTFVLSTTTQALDEFGLIPGQWIFIGGDGAAFAFEDGGEPLSGYARIALDGVTENAIAFDKSTFTPVTTDGAGKTVRIYFGDVLKNEEDPDLIVRFSSTIERTLGKDDDGTQSEYLTGAVANELTWNSPLANLVNLDLGYVAQKAGIRKGDVGPLSRRVGNTIVKALGEDAFNTSSNIFRLRMAVVDPGTFNPLPLFARVTEWTMTVNNNVTSAKAQGVLGGFDTTVGGFDVDGEFTAYFSTVEAIHAVQCNYDLTFDAIYAKANAGLYMDVPLIGLGGGRLDIEQDAAIMLPLETAAAESPFGHTLLIGWFDYLPNLAMPDVDC